MKSWWNSYLESNAQELAMWVLTGTTLLLMAFALVFMLAALAFRLHNDRKKRRLDKLEIAWRPMILEYLAGHLRAKDFRAAIDPRDRYFFVQVLYRYIARIIGREREQLILLAEPFLDEVSRRATVGHPESRAQAVHLLGEFGFNPYTHQLMEAMDDPSPLVALTAARSLARPGYPGIGRIVLMNLPRFGGCSVDFLAALIRGVGSGIAPDLRTILGDAKRETRVRVIAAIALKDLGDPPAADVAEGVLHEREAAPELLAASLQLLGKLGVTRHLPAVRQLLHSNHGEVRVAAAGAMGTLGEKEDMDRLAENLLDPSPWVAVQAARSIQLLGGDKKLRQYVASADFRATVAREVLEESAI